MAASNFGVFWQQEEQSSVNQKIQEEAVMVVVVVLVVDGAKTFSCRNFLCFASSKQALLLTTMVGCFCLLTLLFLLVFIATKLAAFSGK